ncbi:hypothetical protein ANOM_007596 [Aspergillus nomiae NRRL 13137]|uniref:EF-hand domain-containing protein n=1 Tax=Aspergillus nomiae NRRL (strain ATCC 15546 / NRRL 13137 / CBS 260.88 / M93) TaxID=1509407 RepID=A0A0L1IY64_ASPN3|nr:uncharacterized protein ANOM_007596 [Aspergillus nomiae NRRL 13137]KNG84427.1 hypothetical protein ANOM_007596 [Aspergillus nomiae NRRL 13137]
MDIEPLNSQINSVDRANNAMPSLAGGGAMLDNGRYTREEIDYWRARFKEINTSGDRYIEPYEIINAAKKEGFEMSDEEAKEWIDELDENHDGKVSFSEFIKAFGELKSNQ